jgi:hypothetical protein
VPGKDENWTEGFISWNEVSGLREVFLLHLRREILDVLIDDGESILQIEKYFDHFNIEFDKANVIRLLEQLLAEQKIKIQFPTEDRGKHELNIEKVEDYWFELTETGKEEWKAYGETSITGGSPR